MNIEAALKLTDSKALLAAVQEAETRNCEQPVIDQLVQLYYAALDREQAATKRT